MQIKKSNSIKKTNQVWLEQNNNKNSSDGLKKILENNNHLNNVFLFRSPCDYVDNIKKAKINEKYKILCTVNQQVNYINIYEQKSFNDVLIFAKEYLNKKNADKIINRIKELKNIIDDETDQDFSLESLKSCIFFLCLLKNYKSPVITVDINGCFHLDWKPDITNKMIILFNKNKSVEYVFFTPNINKVEKRAYITGNTTIEELITIIKKLSINSYEI